MHSLRELMDNDDSNSGGEARKKLADLGAVRNGLQIRKSSYNNSKARWKPVEYLNPIHQDWRPNSLRMPDGEELMTEKRMHYKIS